MAVLTQHMFEPVPPIEEVNPDAQVPEAIKAVVYKAMAKDTCDRYESMIELFTDLEKCIEDADYLPSHSHYNYRVTSLDRNGRPEQTGKLERTSLDWSPESGVYQKKKGRVGLYAVIAAILLLGGAGAAYWAGYLPLVKDNVLEAKGEISVITQEREGTGEVVEEKDSAKAPEETASDSVEEPAGDEATEDKPVGEPKIAVTIKTRPKGAVVIIEGLGQVCSRTPCDVELPWGTPVSVEANLDNRSKQITFTPSPQNREITLTLKKSRSGRRGGKKPDPKPGGSETRDNGLKIPKLFQNN